MDLLLKLDFLGRISNIDLKLETPFLASDLGNVGCVPHSK